MPSRVVKATRATWASCRRSADAAARRRPSVERVARSALRRARPVRRVGRRGFTLLEILVVLAIVALAAGLVAPIAVQGLRAAEERGVRADVQALLEALPVRAFRDARPLVLDGPGLARLAALPDGWRLQVDAPLRYDASGIADGGQVALHGPGGALLAWRVQPITGSVQAADGAWPGR